MQIDESTFWKLIESLELVVYEDITEADLEPICNALAEMSVEDIGKFEEILTEKLYALDSRAHAIAGIDPRLPSLPDGSEFISSDGFLYQRCYVVANGKQFYEEVLANPSKMPKGIQYEFESLLYVANGAYQQKTGEEDMPQTSELSYETGSNKKGWEESLV